MQVASWFLRRTFCSGLINRTVCAFIGLYSLALTGWPARAADRLVIITPHWDGIRYEFGNGFKNHYQAETGREVVIEWMDVGGTSDVLRFIKSEFSSKPGGIDVDIFFGGGLDPYLELTRLDLLQPYPLPDSIMARLPETVGGYRLYDKQYLWYGATIAGFGIVYNKRVLDMIRLPEPRTWEDLTHPDLFSWIGGADPRKSGSAHMPYEIILQAYGWERGWEIITAMGANTRNFASAGSQTPKDVATGEVAYGMAIDFYAWAQINEVGSDMIGYVMPDNLTIVNPDAIGILRGAPNLETARAFMRYLFSESGQKLWMLKTGAPGGPERYQLDRFAVLPHLYDRIDPSWTSVTLNPFTWSSSLVYDSEKGAVRWQLLNDMIGVFIIDAHEPLRRRWRRAIQEGAAAETLPRLAAMPVSEEEALQLAAGPWKNQEFRNRKLLEWSAFAREKYQAEDTAIPLADRVFLLGSLAAGLGMTGYLWRLNRKRGGK